MQKCFWLFFVVLICSVNCLSQSSTQSFTTKEGSLLEVELKPDKKEIMLGETTFISFEIKNFSDKNLCMTVGGDYRNNVGRPDSYKVTVVRDDGKAVPQPEVKIGMGGLIGCGNIKAKGSYVTKLFLPHWATFTDTGNYKITVKKIISFSGFKGFSLFEKPKNYVIAEVSTTIKIIPTDDEKLGNVIDSLGKTVLNETAVESSNAASILNFINDQRTVKYFAQALEKPSNDFVVRISARSLSKYDSDEAWLTLEKAILSSNDEVRFAVADTLQYKKSPKALELILRMKNDSYWFVRLRVAQAFGEMNTDESTALFRAMLKDENQYVREAAQLGLNNRAPK